MIRLLSIKKITVQKRLAVKLDFTLTKGAHDLKLWFISDSYTGCDQEHEFSVNVAEALEEDSEEESDEDADAMVE